MPHRFRPLFLARVALRAPVVRYAARFVVCAAVAAGAGFSAALVWLAPTTGNPGPLGALSAGILCASLVGGLLIVLSLRANKKEQTSEFARLARRIGEEKTARAELRAALRQLSQAIERAVPEILASDETDAVGRPGDGGNGGGDEPAVGNVGRPGPGEVPAAYANEPWATRRLLRIARTAGLFGGNDLELKRLAFAGPCAEIIEEYRRLAGPEVEILYMEDGGGEWLAAPIDRPLFATLLRELLDNVFAHAGDWNRITVTTEPVAGAIVLRVRDDGRGIPAPSFAALSSGAPAVQRKGLGLVLVRAIVEAHGGTLRVESEPGLGTTVTVRFPTHA